MSKHLGGRGLRGQRRTEHTAASSIKYALGLGRSHGEEDHEHGDNGVLAGISPAAEWRARKGKDTGAVPSEQRPCVASAMSGGEDRGITAVVEAAQVTERAESGLIAKR